MIKLYRTSSAARGEDMKSLLEELNDQVSTLNHFSYFNSLLLITFIKYIDVCFFVQTSDVLNFKKPTALRGLPLFMDKHYESLKNCLVSTAKYNSYYIQTRAG